MDDVTGPASPHVGGFVVLLPVKPPNRGKSRLAELPDAVRRDLAAAFALDAATACLASTRVEQVLAVTDDAGFAGRLMDLGCSAIPDGDSRGLNPVLHQAAAEARRRWPALVPVALCADLPALHPSDLDEALTAAVPGGASYVADASGAGTTTYLAPHEDFDPHFGADSALEHRLAGALAVPGALVTLRLDVDDVADLKLAVALGVGRHTATAVAAHGL